ncbi:YdcF family protein [Candidatus Woesearchaeota archaeon]|nr:YdcF family protein [Candidatus Woesearchaeota archaeon]
MELQHDTAIILSHHINPDRTLDAETKKRTDRGINLLIQGVASTLTVAGGRAQNLIPCTHALAMKNYAVSQGVHARAVMMEEHSLDTVGQALFTKRSVVVPRNWEKLVVVSHDYHLFRVKRIFDFVYGKDFDIVYESVGNDCADLGILTSQQRSLEAFLNTFKGVESGRDDDILVRLYEAHPLYNGMLRR